MQKILQEIRVLEIVTIKKKKKKNHKFGVFFSGRVTNKILYEII